MRAHPRCLDSVHKIVSRSHRFLDSPLTLQTRLSFGSFDRADRAARTARNPKTGVPIDVPAKKAPRFTSSATFKAQVNGEA